MLELLLWLLLVVVVAWIFVGAVLFAPIFLTLYGIYFLGFLVIRRIKNPGFWRFHAGK